MNNNWFVILMAIGLLSCRKETPKSTLPVVNSLPVTITINQDEPGYNIPETFEGLSYETGILTESPDYLNENNTVLIQLIKNLGPGILRIGGNSSDLIHWAGRARGADTPKDSLTTSDIDRLAAFDRAIGWPVLFGLNLAGNKPGAASYEARYVHKRLRDNLYAFQVGNEPDMYRMGPRPSNYDFDEYEQQWNTYLSAVRKKVPEAPFAGPDVTPFNSAWISSFAGDERKNIKLIDGHYYVTGPASKPSISFNSILSPDPKVAAYLGSLHTAASRNDLLFRVSECNSVFGGGKRGVSDVFASALWALDFMWTVADYKGAGVNFHGGGSFFVYSPVAVEDSAFTARPMYYAMLAFKYGAVGQTMLPVKVDGAGYNISAHACVSADNTYSVTLINKEAESSFAFTIKLGKAASKVEVARLTAAGITATAGTTFAGSAVNADGTFIPNVTEQYNIDQKSFVINVPPGSAAVLKIQ